MWIHQLFLPLVGEANEDVLARAFQTLSVVRDEVHEALNVDVIFKVDGQDVSHFRFSWRSSVSPSGNSAFRRLRESKPLYRVHSTITLPVTTRHCEYSLVDKFVFQNLQGPGSPFAHRAVRNQRPVELELKELWKLAYPTDHDVSCSTKSLQLFRVPQPVTRDETFHENDSAEPSLPCSL